MAKWHESADAYTLCSAVMLVSPAIKIFCAQGLTVAQSAWFSRPMTQRNNHPQTAIAKPQGQAVLRAALVTLATLALITVLVLITGSTSAGYGFA
jgi:hypothetical protein